MILNPGRHTAAVAQCNNEIIFTAQASYSFPIQANRILHVIRFEDQFTVLELLDLPRECVAIVHDDDIVFAFSSGKTDNKEEQTADSCSIDARVHPGKLFSHKSHASRAPGPTLLA
jgi:hypothetical protein